MTEQPHRGPGGDRDRRRPRDVPSGRPRRAGERRAAASSTILAEAADVDEAIAAVTQHQPDVVLLDVHLPGGGGVEVMRRMATSGASPDTRYLAL